jgi:ribosome recycling factor
MEKGGNKREGYKQRVHNHRRKIKDKVNGIEKKKELTEKR